MRLFHRTYHADVILAGAFRDGHGTYLTQHEYEGVWLADEPLDVNDGAEGNVLLSLEIPETVVLPHEWVEEAKPFREFLVPAEIVNRYGPPSIDQDER